MGWLYMPSLGRFKTPKEYLEDQYTYENNRRISTVLASKTVALRTWYAACQQIDKSTGQSEIFAVICLIDYNRRAKDGMIFGCKDMTEHYGHWDVRCPISILDLLGPTDNQHARDWRNRCRAYHAKRRRPAPQVGDTIVFADTFAFPDGHQGSQFVVDKRGRMTIFRAEDCAPHYRIARWKSRDWILIRAITPSAVDVIASAL
jgi:hypothetical protein